jgi:polygalacturonase
MIGGRCAVVGFATQPPMGGRTCSLTVADLGAYQRELDALRWTMGTSTGAPLNKTKPVDAETRDGEKGLRSEALQTKNDASATGSCVTDYGATGDGVTDDTDAFSQRWQRRKLGVG